MTPERTELEWKYQPDDFFEAPYRYSDSEYELSVEGGRVIATLCVPQDPVNEELDARIRGQVEDLLLTRQIQVRRLYDLQGPRIYQHVEGRRNVVIQVPAAAVVVSVGQPDFIIRDAAGNIVRDSRAERIAEHTQQLYFITSKLAQSPELREMMKSYSRSIEDPSNELLYLYEIRDALSKHYGGEGEARVALSISNAEWKRLGRLANEQPLEQGRHRGKHLVGRRAASEKDTGFPPPRLAKGSPVDSVPPAFTTEHCESLSPPYKLSS
jgi:hypothetical protein